LAVFVALMGTSAVALATKSIFNNFLADVFVYGLEIIIISVFLYHLAKFLIHLKGWNNLSNNLKSPLKSGMYSAMPIASALISILFINVGLPYLDGYNALMGTLFWAISLIFSAIFIVAVPISIKFRMKPEDVTGTWFIPPVGLFVLINAGAVLSLKTSFMPHAMTMLNLLIMGPAFMLYLLTLSLVYYRSKFHPLSASKIAPTFTIVLAPVGVSILAMLSTAKLMLEYDIMNIGTVFAGISRIYSVIIFGYGLWVVIGLIALYFRIMKEHKNIPFSELWWAFIFPLGAFTLATGKMAALGFAAEFFTAIEIILYVILMVAWIFVAYNYTKGILAKG